VNSSHGIFFFESLSRPLSFSLFLQQYQLSVKPNKSSCLSLSLLIACTINMPTLTSHSFLPLSCFIFFLLILISHTDGKAALGGAKTTTATVTTVKPTVKPKNPVVTIAKAKIMGTPLTEQEWLNMVFGQLSPR
jgi:hypothetical protein